MAKKSVKIGDYTVTINENASVEVDKGGKFIFKNTMEGLREVAKELNFTPDPKAQGWNTQRYGSAIVKFAQTGEMPTLKEESAEVAEETTDTFEVPEEYKGLPIIEIETKEIDLNDCNPENYTEYPIVGGVFVGYEEDYEDPRAVVGYTLEDFCEEANYRIDQIKSNFCLNEDSDEWNKITTKVIASTKISGYGQAEDIEEMGKVIGCALNAYYGYTGLFGSYSFPDWFAKKAIFIVDGHQFTVNENDHYEEIDLSDAQLNALKAALTKETAELEQNSTMPIIEIETKEIDIYHYNAEEFTDHPIAGVTTICVDDFSIVNTIVYDTVEEFCEYANKGINIVKECDLTKEEAEKAVIRTIASTKITGYGCAKNVKEIGEVIGCGFVEYYAKGHDLYFDYTWPDWFPKEVMFIVDGEVFIVDKDGNIKMKHHLSEEQLNAMKASLS